MIPNEVITEIREHADIEDVISNYIKVIKHGNSSEAICPFHADTNPSLKISKTKQIFSCFVCHTSGNVFSFVEQYEKIPFIEAVKKVAELTNFSSPYLKNEERKVDPKKKEALKCLKDATELYHYVLSTQAGKSGLDYLTKRNIDEEMINYFSLGFAPINGELTIKQLRQKENSIEALENSGILVRNQDTFLDRFRGRVIFPIYNEYSEVIGYSGRKIEDNEEAKYVNSPSTILFNKSDVLYNYQNAKIEAKKEGYCYVVEGFMDVFSLYKAGIKSCVALMGTAFTKYHAKMLKRLGVEIRLCLDGDHPGQHGMLNMIPLLDEAGITYRFVNYEDEVRDPDEIYNELGKDALISRVNTLVKKNTFVINYLTNRKEITSIDEKKEFLNSLARYYQTLSDDLDKELMINEASKITNLNSQKILNYFKKLDTNNIVSKKEEVAPHFNFTGQSLKAKQRIQRNLIFYMLKSKEAHDYILNSQVSPFQEDIYLYLANYVSDMYSLSPQIDVSDLITRIQKDGSQMAKKLVDELTAIQLDKQIPDNFNLENVQECLEQIVKINSKEQMRKTILDDSLENDELEKAKKIDKYFAKK